MFEAMFIVGPFGLMEVIHVELSDERREVIVFEESRQYSFREFVLFLHDE